MAEGIATLLDSIRTAGSEADKERAAEKKPHWDAGQAVDTKWKALIARASLATDTCKQALSPWLNKKQKEKDAADKLAREEANKKLAEAQAAIRDSAPDDLGKRALAEDQLESAKRADGKAKREARQGIGIKPKSGGRAVSLRRSYEPILDDPEKALEHFWPNIAIEECLTQLAKNKVSEGIREIPGFRVIEKKGTA